MKKIFAILGCVLLTGCYPQKNGPYNLSQDSLHYNQALQTSVDSQLLLNIVRLRYRDTPSFLQVGTISSSYENSCSVGSNFNFNALNQPTSVISITPNVSVERIEKPTTTYQPVRGENFVKEFLSPISLQTMVLLNNSGWKIDRIMRTCVQRLNEIKNAPTASGPTPSYAPAYEDFLELSSWFAQLERKDAVDLVVEKNGQEGDLSVFLVFDKEDADPAIMQKIWTALDVEPGSYHIRLVAYHGKRRARNDVVVDTRSPMSVLYYLSQGVHVPDMDKMLGKVTVTEADNGCEFDWDQVLSGIMKIYAGPLPCEGTPSSLVYYRGTFFYIDDADLDSKSTFSMLTQLLALQISSPPLPMTVFTIPLD